MALSTLATSLINTLGYKGVAIGLGINTIGIPLPSELTLMLGGVGINQGRFNLVAMAIVATLAQIVGLGLSYAIGRYGGLELIHRYGKYVLISSHDVESAQKFFERNGEWVVLLGLCLPAVHGYMGYPAGIAKMAWQKFLLAAVIGSIIWSAVFLSLGYYLGNHLSLINTIFNRFAIVIAVLVLAGVIWYIRRHLRRTAA